MKLQGTVCPKCKIGNLNAIGERTGGFSGGKAAVGGILLGPIGIAAGALGKKKQHMFAVNVVIQ